LQIPAHKEEPSIGLVQQIATLFHAEASPSTVDWRAVTKRGFGILRAAAADTDYVSGLTHNFYRYPARFSPRFAAAAIDSFSQPGDLVLDPFMGGGTTAVEALAAGRRFVGSDINALGTFVTKVKTTLLGRLDIESLRGWCEWLEEAVSYTYPRDDIEPHIDVSGTRNLNLPNNRAIKKGIAVALQGCEGLPSLRSRQFARCVVLRTAQWALDARRRPTSLSDFRSKLLANTDEMLRDIQALSLLVRNHHIGRDCRTLLTMDACNIHAARVFRQRRWKADLVVTSPPYPGIHVVYNRWQVDGRRETPAPYWIAACRDGDGQSHYTFGDRREQGLLTYFDTAVRAFCGVREVVRTGSYVVQLVAFSRPQRDLPRYLTVMSEAGFEEVRSPVRQNRRMWRDVPNRKWHASIKGTTGSSREVVLVHRAV
jgi:hypothetical protein